MTNSASYLTPKTAWQSNRENDILELSHESGVGTQTAEMGWESGNEPDFLRQIQQEVRVALIKTQRLQTEVAIEKPIVQRDSGNGERPSGLAVDEQSKRAATLIHEVQSAAGITVSQVAELRPIVRDLLEALEGTEESELEDDSVILEQMN